MVERGWETLKSGRKCRNILNECIREGMNYILHILYINFNVTFYEAQFRKMHTDLFSFKLGLHQNLHAAKTNNNKKIFGWQTFSELI
jgi:hypothetical protein